MSAAEPLPGQRVRVLSGRYADREGVLVGYHHNPGGMIQQAQSYPVVDLDPRGRARARRVRVLAVAKTSPTR